MGLRGRKKRDLRKDRTTLRWIYERLKSHTGVIVYMTASNALEAFLEVWTAVMCKQLIDSATGGNHQLLLKNAAVLLLMLMGPVTLNFFYQMAGENVKNQLRIVFQNSALRHFMASPYRREGEYHSEEVLNRVFNDTAIVTEGIIELIPLVVYFAVELCVAVAALFYFAPGFTVFFLAGGFVLGAVIYLLGGRLKRYHRQVQKAEDNLRMFLQDVLTNSLVIRAFFAQSNVEGKTDRYQKAYYKARMKKTLFNKAAGSGLSIVFTFGYWAVMLWGSYEILNGKIGYGTLVAMLELVGRVQAPVSGLTSFVSEFFNILASSERIMELEEENPGEKERSTEKAGGGALKQGFGSIRVNHITFGYDQTPVLRDVSMEVQAGDFLALTGMSGGGKTTLFLLLLGAYQPEEGEILFLDEQGQGIRPDERAGLFAYVPQENGLFTGTIRDNITLFDEHPDEERIFSALRTACAVDFVEELPEGIDTPLQEKGHSLSEGQMQRISIARAIYSGAKIFLLDEATSALDMETEESVLRNLSGLADTTCIMVTHREKALSYCTRHFVMEKDTVREMPSGSAESG